MKAKHTLVYMLLRHKPSILISSYLVVIFLRILNSFLSAKSFIFNEKFLKRRPVQFFFFFFSPSIQKSDIISWISFFVEVNATLIQVLIINCISNYICSSRVKNNLELQIVCALPRIHAHAIFTSL